MLNTIHTRLRQTHRTPTRTLIKHSHQSTHAPALRNVTGCSIHSRVDQTNYKTPPDLNVELFEWAKARTQAMQVDVSKLNENPYKTDTTLLPPWRTVLVPKKRIENLKHHHYYYCSPSIWMWNIGYGRPVAHCNPYDINPGAIDSERSSRRPGQGKRPANPP